MSRSARSVLKLSVGLAIAGAICVAGCDDVDLDEPEGAIACAALPWARGLDPQSNVFMCPGTNIPLGSSRPVIWENRSDMVRIRGNILGLAPALPAFQPSVLGVVGHAGYGVELRTCGDLGAFCPGTGPVSGWNNQPLPPLPYPWEGLPHGWTGQRPPPAQYPAEITSYFALQTVNGFWMGETENVVWDLANEVHGRVWFIELHNQDGQLTALQECDEQFQDLLPRTLWRYVVDEVQSPPAEIYIDQISFNNADMAVQMLLTYPRTDWSVPATDLFLQPNVVRTPFVVAWAEEYQSKLDDDNDLVCGSNEQNYGVDNCPNVQNHNQQNSDCDARGDACDNCRDVANGGQEDGNADGVGDACEPVTLQADMAAAIPAKINALLPAPLEITVPFQLRAVTPNAPFDPLDVRIGLYRGDTRLYSGVALVEQGMAQIQLPIGNRTQLVAGDYVVKLGAYRESCGTEELVSEVTRPLSIYRFGFVASGGNATSALTVFEDPDDDGNHGVLDRELNQAPYMQNGSVADDDLVEFRIEAVGVVNPRFQTPSGMASFVRIERNGAWFQGALALPAQSQTLRLQGRQVTASPITLQVIGTVDNQAVFMTAGVTVQSSNCLRNDPDGRRRVLAQPWLTNRDGARAHLRNLPVNVCTLNAFVDRQGIRVHYTEALNVAERPGQLAVVTQIADWGARALEKGRAAGLGSVPRIGDSDQILDVYIGDPTPANAGPDDAQAVAVRFDLPPDNPATPQIEFDPRTTQCDRVLILASDAPIDTIFHEVGHYLLPDAPQVAAAQWLNESAANAVEWLTVTEFARIDLWRSPGRAFDEEQPFLASFYNRSPDAYGARYTAWPIFTYIGDANFLTGSYRRVWEALAYAQYNQFSAITDEDYRYLSWRAVGCGTDATACDPLRPKDSLDAARGLLESLFLYVTDAAPQFPLNYDQNPSPGSPNLPYQPFPVTALGRVERVSGEVAAMVGSPNSISGISKPLHLRYGSVARSPTGGIIFDTQTATLDAPMFAENNDPQFEREWLLEQMTSLRCDKNPRRAHVSFELISSTGGLGKASVWYPTLGEGETVEMAAGSELDSVVYLQQVPICLEATRNLGEFRVAFASIFNTSLARGIDVQLRWTITW